jgi:hypothetical protein
MTWEGVLRSVAVLSSPSMDFVDAGTRWDAEVWSVIASEWPTKPSKGEIHDRL